MNINKNFLNVSESYLFSTIAKKVNAYSASNPDKKIIKMGIGDVTLPICSAVTEAMQIAGIFDGEPFDVNYCMNCGRKL